MRLAEIFSLSFKNLMARRDSGSEIHVFTTETGLSPSDHPYAPRGSPFANLTFQEGQARGTALVYWDRERNHLVMPSIKTLDPTLPSAKKNMAPGAGTLILTWLCALALQEGASFEVFHIQNPRILRILTRLLDCPQATLEFCQNVDDATGLGFEILAAEKGLAGEAQYNRHPDSTFTIVRGPVRPDLLESLPGFS